MKRIAHRKMNTPAMASAKVRRCPAPGHHRGRTMLGPCTTVEVDTFVGHVRVAGRAIATPPPVGVSIASEAGIPGWDTRL
jgi:hypothetical protein